MLLAVSVVVLVLVGTRLAFPRSPGDAAGRAVWVNVRRDPDAPAWVREQLTS